MTIAIGILLIFIAIGLWQLGKRGLLGNEALDRIEKILSIVAVIAAILLFMFPRLANITDSEIEGTSIPEKASSPVQDITSIDSGTSTVATETPSSNQPITPPTPTIQSTPVGVAFATPTSTAIPELAPIALGNGNRIELLGTFSGQGYALMFSPSGDYLVTPWWNGLILYETTSWRQIQEVNPLSRTRGLYAVFSPDERFAAFTDFYGNVRLLELTAGKRLVLITDITDESADSIAFSPLGDQLVTAGADGIRIWSLADGTLIAQLEGHSEVVYSLSYSDDGKFLISGSQDGTIKVWSVQDNTLKTTIRIGSLVRDVEVAPNGTLIASATWDGIIRLWNLEDGSLISMLEGHTDHVNGLAFTNDGSILASASDDQTIRLWRVDDGMLVTTVNSGGETDDVAFSPDGTVLASLGGIASSAGLQIWGIPEK
jgi:WD40 repeat protein